MYVTAFFEQYQGYCIDSIGEEIGICKPGARVLELITYAELFPELDLVNIDDFLAYCKATGEQPAAVIINTFTREW
ncbi:MAG: hypothetical protein AB7F25_12305 [Deferribacterales bacterium]